MYNCEVSKQSGLGQAQHCMCRYSFKLHMYNASMHQNFSNQIIYMFIFILFAGSMVNDLTEDDVKRNQRMAV